MSELTSTTDPAARTSFGRSVPRRTFLRRLLGLSAGAVAAALVPAGALAAAPPRRERLIRELRVIKVAGTRTVVRGVDEQPHITRKNSGRPMPVYRDAGPQETTEPLDHHYLEIVTEGGHRGFYGHLDWDATPKLGQIARQLVGEDALAIEHLFDRMVRTDRFSHGHQYRKSVAAVDNTLWDLRGRMLGMPVWQLLGGPTREAIPVYVSCLGFSVEPERAAAKAAELLAGGFPMQKWFAAYGPADGQAGLVRNVELAGALHEALGRDGEFAIDVSSAWSVPYAMRWAQRVAAFGVKWLEEPVPMDQAAAYRRLIADSPVPIAAGEHFGGSGEAARFLEMGLPYVQADPEWCGGVSELVRIAHLAAAAGAQVYPHGHNIYAQLHVVAAMPPTVCPRAEYLTNWVAYKTHFEKAPPRTTNQFLDLPAAPGFGIELDEDRIETRSEYVA